MRDLIEKADEIPVTLVVLVAYVTLAFMTGVREPDSEKLAAYGWMTALAVSEGEWWRLLTSSFLHGGLLHLAMNSFALMQLGPAVERSLGSARFLALYAIAELGSSLAVCLVYDPRMPVVGGSGATDLSGCRNADWTKPPIRQSSRGCVRRMGYPTRSTNIRD